MVAEPEDEPGDEPGDVRIDAHHHLWDVTSGRYTWPTPAEGTIYRTFTMADLEPDLAASGISGTVLVQTVNTLDDTDSMLEVAARHPVIRGVVGWAPLTDQGALEAVLDARQDPVLVGIRHLIHHEPDPEWLVRRDVAAGLATLARRRLAFDVVAVFPAHLGLVPRVADDHPDLTLVIDHLAKPPFRSAGWDVWKRQLRAAAARPNVLAKVSGLDTAAGPGWTLDEIRPAIDEAIDAFGPHRLAFGSDWPVCRLVSDYAAVVELVERATSALARDERRSILGGTAIRAYGLQ